MFNRGELIKRIEQEIDSAKRYDTIFSLIMYDLDHFKHINDKFGHPEGDYVLKTSAGLVKERIRTTDIAARWGGEEFMVLMPRTNLASAHIVAEKLRHTIATHQFHTMFSVTASFGITEFLPQDDLNLLLKRVDDALYQAKKKGRNRVEAL